MKQSEYDERVKALKEDVRPSETCYKPSGETPPASILMLIPLSLLVAGVCYAAARPICTLFWEMLGDGGGSARSFSEQWSQGNRIAFWVFIVNFVIFIVIALVATFSFKFVAYITKLRNPTVGRWFSFFSVLVVCAALYLPLYDGHSLAPTDITFFFIPVSWILMFVGCLVLPFIVSLNVAGTLLEMKFCEKSGQFLKEVAEAPLSWANGKQFMHALANKEYSNLAQYIVPYKKLEIPYMVFRLFGHPGAQVAFVDMEAKYEAIIGSATNETNTDWLVYHEKLTQDEARSLSNSLPAQNRTREL